MKTKNLAEKAMLVNVVIKGCSFRKLDKKATAKVNADNNASHDAGRYNKALLAKEHLKDISRISGGIRSYHYNNTLAWSDSGGRILPASHYLEYIGEMNRMMEERKDAVASLVKNYPQYVEHAKNNLGKMFNEQEYPEQSVISGKFSTSVSVLPLPIQDDFRVDLQDDIANEIRSNIEQEFQNSIGTAMTDIWGRLKEAVVTMQTKLTDEDAVFRNSLFSNLCELCELLDKFNIADDPNLKKIKIEIEDKLCNYDPDTIRHDKSVRENVAKEAKDILDTMAGYC